MKTPFQNFCFREPSSCIQTFKAEIISNIILILSLVSQYKTEPRSDKNQKHLKQQTRLVPVALLLNLM